ESGQGSAIAGHLLVTSQGEKEELGSVGPKNEVPLQGNRCEEAVKDFLEDHQARFTAHARRCSCLRLKHRVPPYFLGQLQEQSQIGGWTSQSVILSSKICDGFPRHWRSNFFMACWSVSLMDSKKLVPSMTSSVALSAGSVSSALAMAMHAAP